MAEMSTWIHIGLGKTATTTLQRLIFSQHPDIIYLGKNWHESESAKAQLLYIARQVPHRFDGEAAKAIFSDMIRNERQSHPDKRAIVLSEEDFSTCRFLDPSIIARRMASILPGSKILLVIREPVDWLQSMYYFRLSLRFREALNGFEQWLETSLAQPVVGTDIGQLRLDSLANAYSEEFGRGNVRVMLYEDFRKDPDSFLDRIATEMQIDPAETIRLYRQAPQGRDKSRITKRQERFLLNYRLVLAGRYQEYLDIAAPLMEALSGTLREKAAALIPKDLSSDNHELERQFHEFSAFLDRTARNYLLDSDRASAELTEEMRDRIRQISEPGLRYVRDQFGVHVSPYLERLVA